MLIDRNYSVFALSSGTSSRLPIITLPVINNDAPTHHSNGRLSPKMSAPRIAVMTKFAAVLTILTWTADGDRDKAWVKRAHIVLLRTKYITNTSCLSYQFQLSKLNIDD